MLISTAWQIANSANLLNLPVPPIPDVSGVGSALEVPLVKDTGVLNLVVGAAPQTLSCGSTSKCRLTKLFELKFHFFNSCLQ